MSLAAASLANRVALEQQRRHDASAVEVLLLPPNLVCHARLALALAAAAMTDSRPGVALLLFAACIALDALDGWLARKLGQATAFGAFYDVAIDNLARAMLWSAGPLGSWAAAPIVLEGITFACTHASGGAAWKTGCFRDSPRWVQAVVAGGFRSPTGALAMAGLFGCPLWLFARARLPSSAAAAGPWGVVVVPGRVLAAAVEVWLVARRAGQLLHEDAAARLRSAD